MGFGLTEITNKVLNAQEQSPATQKDFSRFTILHSNPTSQSTLTTTASTVYSSLVVNVAKALRTRVFLQSNNQGTLNVLYTYDGTFWIANAVTGTVDPVSGKYIYEWTKDAPCVQVKYQYTETASAGAIYGGVAILEKVVI